MFKILKFISLVGVFILFFASLVLIATALYQIYIQYIFVSILAGTDTSFIQKLILLLLNFRILIGLILGVLSLFVSFKLFFSVYANKFPTLKLVAALLLPGTALILTVGDGSLFGAGISGNDIFSFFIGYAVITLPISLSFVFAKQFNDMKNAEQGIQ